MRFIFELSGEMNDLEDGGMKGEGCSVWGYRDGRRLGYRDGRRLGVGMRWVRDTGP